MSNSTWVLVCWGHADFSHCPETGQYLKSYDLEARDGRGEVIWTTSRDEALHFPSFMIAVETWKQPSLTHPIRETDGKANRPLTAYSVQPMEVSDGQRAS